MDWKSLYHARIVTAEEAVRVIKSGQRLFLTGNVSVPFRVLDALVAYAPELRDVEICQALTVGNPAYVGPEMEGHLRVNTMFISANIRKAVQEGRADFTPVPNWLRSGHWKLLAHPPSLPVPLLFSD